MQVASRERHSRCLRRRTTLVTKIPNRFSEVCKAFLTIYEVVQFGTGKLAKISQGMHAVKSILYF